MSGNEILPEGKKVPKTCGALKAVWQVDFDVRQGEILGIIGPNGAGKTTSSPWSTEPSQPHPGRSFSKEER
jgi:branched-chain amino acid transport system ATP-binding protein